MSALFCFGLGYSASALARRLNDGAWSVRGTSRASEGAAPVAARGFGSHVFDGKTPGNGVAEALAHSTHVLVSIPPDGEGDPVLRCHAEDLVGAANVRWVGYLSTIGVYGDTGGGWVDEESPPRPASPRAARRLEAEDAWRTFGKRAGKCVQIFRLGGIYGPGRSAIEELREGTARRIVKAGQVFNRIHVADIAGVLSTAMGGRGTHSIYNVVDDEPAPPQDVVAFAAALLGLSPSPEIPFETADLSPMARSFYSANRRVRNERIKSDLGAHLAFPSYREGLKSILAATHQA